MVNGRYILIAAPVLRHPGARLPIYNARDVPVIIYEDIVRAQVVVSQANAIVSSVNLSYRIVHHCWIHAFRYMCKSPGAEHELLMKSGDGVPRAQRRVHR